MFVLPRGGEPGREPGSRTGRPHLRRMHRPLHRHRCRSGRRGLATVEGRDHPRRVLFLRAPGAGSWWSLTAAMRQPQLLDDARPLPNDRPDRQCSQREHALIHFACLPRARVAALEARSTRLAASEVLNLSDQRALHRAECERPAQRFKVHAQLKSPTSPETPPPERSASHHAEHRRASYRGQAWDRVADKADPRSPPRLAHQFALQPHRGRRGRHHQQRQRHERGEETRHAAHETSYTSGDGSLNSRSARASEASMADAYLARGALVATDGLVRVRAYGTHVAKPGA